MSTDNNIDPNWTVEEFMRRWLSRPEFRPPVDCPVSFDGSLFGVVLYRCAPFQVQLLVVAPGSEIPDHVHPNVDNVEIYFSGDIAFRKHGRLETTPEHWSLADDKGWLALAGQTIEVKPTDPHGAFIGPRGGSFLSVQKWLNGVPATSVTTDWAWAGADRLAKCYVKEEAAHE